MQMVLLALLPVPPKFTGESGCTDEAQWQTNADILRGVFDLVLVPLLQVDREGTVVHSADGKTRLWFLILSAWIADPAKDVALQEICSKSRPKGEVPCQELSGNLRRMYETSDYQLDREKALRQEPAEAAGIAEYFQRLGIIIGNNLFTGLDRVSPADLHKPHPLPTFYLGLFKHMMEWVEGFPKKHKWQQGFDNAWTEIPPNMGCSLQKKAYCEIRQSQGKEMPNCGCGILAVLPSALQNLVRSLYHDFQSALKWVTALLDFTLMAQYGSHTPDILF